MSDQGTTIDFWGIAAPWIQGAIFFILGVVATFVVERQGKLRRDYELWAWESNDSLSKSDIGASRDHLQYVVNGRTVADPYEVSVDVWANGKKDLPAAVFNSRDARIELGVPIVGVLAHSEASTEETSISLAEEEGVIRIHPSVVRRGMAAHWRFLTDGKPDMKLLSAPLDTDFTSWRETYTGPRRGKTAARLVGILCIVAGLAFFVLGIILARNDVWDVESSLIFVAPLTSLGVVGGGALIMMAGVAEGRTLKSARKALESRRMTKVESTDLDEQA